MRVEGESVINFFLNPFPYFPFQTRLQMVLLHLQIELWPWYCRLYHNDVNVCWFQFDIQSTAERMDGHWLYVRLLRSIFRCTRSRHE